MPKSCRYCGVGYDDGKILCDRCGDVLVSKSVLSTLVNQQISEVDYQTSADTACLYALENIPVFPDVLRLYLNWWQLPQSRAQLLGDGIELNSRQLPDIYSILVHHAQQLNISVPGLFVAYRDPMDGDFGINAYTTGTQDAPIIFLSSALIDAFSKEELSFVIGHECGHIKSNHVLFGSVARVITNVIAGSLLLSIPILSSAAKLLSAPILAWNRQSEFSADRAGLLCCNDIKSSIEALVRLTVGSDVIVRSMNVTSFLDQRDKLKSFHGKVNQMLNRTHPYVVQRVEALLNFFMVAQGSLYNDVSIARRENSIGRADLPGGIMPTITNEHTTNDGFCEYCGFPVRLGEKCPLC
jgi:Zn-dependent protease with chaperone function